MSFNKKLTDLILLKCRNLSLANQESLYDGRFLADKSYGFDTMFFVTRYIQRFRFGDLYKRDNKERENEYIRDLFCLREAAQVKNYFTETLALLRFVNAVEKLNNNTYRIIDEDIMEIYSSSFENAYIFHYLLTYSIFHTHHLWDTYIKFCKAETLQAKQQIYNNEYYKKYVLIDKRIKDPEKSWAKFVAKYPMVILNYANRQNMVARTTNISKDTVTREDIALNVKGNRANLELQKKNAYLHDLSESYIIESIRPYLITKIDRFDSIKYTDSFSVDVADTKLDMLQSRDGQIIKRKSQGDKYKYTGKVKTRTVQGEFRNSLLQKTPHVCPICGFSFEDLLIASHIKPYSKCEDTYDAMNPNNGLLMCPVCDKLFESANYITIEPDTGKVIYVDRIECEKDLQYLHDVTINYDYIDCERRHYIRWHYNCFTQKHLRQKKE